MEGRDLTKIFSKRSRVLVLLLSIILLSGCVYPGSYAPESKPFEKKIERIAENEEGYKVIDLVEKADILDFLNLTADDPKITGYNSHHFIRNISQTLIDIEREYVWQGFLNYSIGAKYISIENYTEIKTHVENQFGRFSGWFSDTIGLIGYIPNESENETQIEELSRQNNMNDVLEKTNLSSNLWLVTVFIHYWFLHAAYRGGEWETSSYRVAVYLINPRMDFIVIIAG